MDKIKKPQDMEQPELILMTCLALLILHSVDTDRETKGDSIEYWSRTFSSVNYQTL
jgi:hypothetical protein